MHKVVIAIVLALLLIATAHRSVFADDAAPAAVQDGASAVSRCGELCGELYRNEPENRDLCREGCAEAERCTNRCNKEFAADGDKLARCNYRCARAR